MTAVAAGRPYEAVRALYRLGWFRRDPDICVVETGPLREALEGYVAACGQRAAAVAWGHPSDGGFGPSVALARLAVRTRDQDAVWGLGVPVSTIWNIYLGAHRLTELRTADAILTALNRIDVFRGDIRVLPNPNLPRRLRSDEWRGCSDCGGSMQQQPVAA